MNRTHSLSRNAAIAQFLLKYRGAGVFKPSALDRNRLPEPAAEPVKECTTTPEDFVTDLEALGPTFIKIGQTLSTRPDLVEEPYRVALERMQNNVAPVPFEQVRATVEDELGVRLSKAFESFEDKPLAAASLAQVHAAVLRSGRAVAVKVQRPDICAGMRSDLDTLARLAGTADTVTDLGRRYRFSDWVAEFERTLANELDFRLEAANLQRFAEKLRAYPTLYIPLPIIDLTSAKVLTMERVLGHKMTVGLQLRRMEGELGPLARDLVRAYLDQVFVHGLIHADPHPGNLLLTDDGRLALIDLGMVAHVPPRMRERLFKLLLGVIGGRGEDVAETCMDLGTRLEDFDELGFVRETGRMIAQYQAAMPSDRSEGRLLLALTRLGADCALRPPPEITLLGKTLLNLDTAARQLDPDLDLTELTQTHMHNVLTQQVFNTLSPSNLAGELVEMHELMRDMPRRAHSLLRNLSDNRFRIDIGGLEETQMIENLQKIANRIAAGIITAALIIGAALMMRIQTSTTLFGYPALALVMFLLAAAVGLVLIVSSLRRDRTAPPKEHANPK